MAEVIMDGVELLPKISQLSENIADQYNPASTYASGAFCIHDGVLYKSNTAIAVAEPWTAAHWTSTKVTAEYGGGGVSADAVTIVKLTDSTETMSAIKARLDAINTAGQHVFFDTASIGPLLYLCTIYIDTVGNVVRVYDLVTGKQYISTYDGTKTIGTVLGEAVDGYVPLIVTCATNDGVTVTGVSVQLRNGNSPTSIVVETKAYSGQPVTFMVARNFVYTLTMSGSLVGHFSPNVPSGIATQAAAITITYQDLSSVTTFAGIAGAVQEFDTEAEAQEALLGKEIEDTWIDENGTSYSDPMFVAAVKTVEDANGNTHRAAIMQRKWATLREIQFDAPEQVEATEATAQEGVYYYGLNGTSVSAANITPLNLTAGATIPYGDYTKVFKNSLNDSSKSIFTYGDNNWARSAYRQYLNSSAALGSWWQASHIGDSAPTQLNTVRGYMAGCSAALLAAAKPIKVRCMKNTITDNGQAEDTVDTLWLPSGIEMYGTSNVGEGTYWQYWKEATGWGTPSDNSNDGRKIYAVNNHASSCYCRLRSPFRGYSSGAWFVSTTGSISYYSAGTAFRCAPACAIY